MKREQMKVAVADCMASIQHTMQMNGAVMLDDLLETESIILALNCLYLTGASDSINEFAHDMKRKGKNESS